MSLLRSVLIKASGNRIAQSTLEFVAEGCQYLMGIGSGTGVMSSGEREVLRLLTRTQTAPYCILDVGSNAGQFLALVKGAVRAEFSIHCFEPGRQSFAQLAAGTQGDDRVILNNLAIGRQTGVATLHYDNAGSELASLTRRRMDHFSIEFAGSESVAIDTIDNYCSRAGIEHVHLLKIDVEGHELDALAGARRLFERGGIDIVTFEFGGCNIDTRSFFQDFWYFFRDLDMRLYRITPSGYLSRIERYRELHEQFRTTNFVATKLC